MKTNDRLLIVTTAIYSFLFYKQNAGINFLLFNLVFISILLIRDKNLLQQKKWLLACGICLVSACGILFHSSALAVLANITGLLLLSAFSFRTQTSAIFSFLFSCYSVGTSVVQVMIDASVRSMKHDQKESGGQRSYKVFTIFLVLILCILFFVLYRQSNPLFAENTQWINFDSINLSWFFFTGAGFFIIYGLFYHKTILQVDAWEQKLPVHSQDADPEKAGQNRAELSSGILLFSLLNGMLIILNAGDINTIWFKGVLPKGVTHSDFVHDGISLIILSIVIAVGLIMFLYRKDFNAIKGAGLLKMLVYAWIFQNLIMLFSIACRNQLYIRDYNLTHKRVGVYIWLFLAAIGLLITFIKIRMNRSNWFLVRSNFATWFGFLALSSTLNWDVMITRYNLNNKPLTDVDFYYLFSLSDSNIPELLDVAKNKDFYLINGELKNYKNSDDRRPFTFKQLMKRKVGSYLKNRVPNWQSWDLTDNRIMNNLIKH